MSQLTENRKLLMELGFLVELNPSRPLDEIIWYEGFMNPTKFMSSQVIETIPEVEEILYEPGEVPPKEIL